MENLQSKTLALSLLTFTFFTFVQTASASVVINEINWVGSQSSANDEWIELFNTATTSISLGGWILKSADGKLKIDLAKNIPGQGFFLLERTDDNSASTAKADLIYQGALGNDGERLQLLDQQGKIIDELDCLLGWLAGDNETKQTMERKSALSPSQTPLNWQNSPDSGGSPKLPNYLQKIIVGEIQLSESQTPNLNPPTQTVQNLQPTTATPEIKNVLLNEILPSPTGADSENEWVELYNANDFEVSLGGWKIKDRVGLTKTYTFPKGSKITTNGFLVVSRSQSNITLQNSGDGIELTDHQGNIIDQADYQTAPQGQSWNKARNSWFWSSILTPGATNIVKKESPTPAATNKSLVDKTTSSAAINPNIHLADIARTTSPGLNRALSFLAAILVAAISAVVVFLMKKKTSRTN